MITLDASLLDSVGLGELPPHQQRIVLQQIYATLEMRVGIVLAGRMTDAQLDEFETFVKKNDETGALSWLEANFSDYKEAVSDQFESLKQEIGRDAQEVRRVLDELALSPPFATDDVAGSPSGQAVSGVPE